MVSIQLIGCDFQLQLVDKEGWCSVILLFDNQTKELGADSKKIVTNRFLSILDVPNFPELKMTISAHQYARFIALFEKHTFGYARPTNLGVELHFRNGLDDEPITTVNLSVEECKTWKNQLNQWLEQG